MKQTSYQRRPGDFEIRILTDGRLVLLAPDQTLLAVAQTLQVSDALEKLPCQERSLHDGQTTGSDDGNARES